MRATISPGSARTSCRRSGPRSVADERALTAAPLRPQPERLYGRQSGHRLRARQRALIDDTLPRVRFPVAASDAPRGGFGGPVDAIRLEIGFGAGEHALALAAAHPGDGLIACEVFLNGIASLLGHLVPVGGEATAPVPAHLRIWDGDARALLRRLPDASLDAVFLLFPDPWPKARHAKRRFVHPDNLLVLARVMRAGAEWRIASDDPTYQASVASVLASQDLFEVPAPAVERPPGWPPTRYEAKALREGRQPLYWRLTRR